MFTTLLIVADETDDEIQREISSLVTNHTELAIERIFENESLLYSDLDANASNFSIPSFSKFSTETKAPLKFIH